MAAPSKLIVPCTGAFAASKYPSILVGGVLRQRNCSANGRFVEEQLQGLGCRNADFFIDYLWSQLDLPTGAPHRSL